MKKGSITIFFALILVFIMGLFFSMAEVVRWYGLNQDAYVISRESIASGFSEFDPVAYSRFGIPGLDMGYLDGKGGTGMMEKRLKGFAENNSSCKGQFTSLECAKTKVNAYGIYTDHSGSAFIHYGCLARLKGILKSQKEVAGSIPQPSAYKSPTGILKTVMVGGVVISAKEVTGTPLEKRTLNKGQDGEKTIKVSSAVEKGMFVSYISNTYSCYTSRNYDEPLDYQMEYIIGGKNSDEENLRTVVSKLLAERSAINLTTIHSFPSKVSEAEAVAAFLCSLAGNPEGTPGVREGLLAAWAYGESVLDVRTLLDGEKIALVKTEDQWTSDMNIILTINQTALKAKNCENGLDYKSYLEQFLALENPKKLAYRAMDIVEQVVRSNKGFENFRMDNMAYFADVKYEYSASNMFFSLILMPSNAPSGYRFEKETSLIY